MSMSPNDTHRNTISTLNGLIETTLDGEKGFNDASGHAHDPELKTLFAGFASDCSRSAREMQECVIELGGKAETGGTTVGALHRGWINIKASMSSDDDLMLLEECERGEDHAKAEYQKAMRETLSPNVRSLLVRQTEGAKIHHDRIRDLRNRGRAEAASH